MSRKNHSPDAFTDRKRRDLFDPKDGKHKGREELIRYMDFKKHGINPMLQGRAIMVPERIASMWKKRGLGEGEVSKAQALAVNRIACKWVDHFISGQKEIGLIKVDIPKYEEKRIWDEAFDSFIERIFLTKEGKIEKRNGEIYRASTQISPEKLKMRKDIVAEMDKIQNFSRLPKKLFKARQTQGQNAHGRRIEKIVWELIRRNVNPEENFLREVERIAKRKYSGKIVGNKEILRIRAMDICLAASIYADIMEKKHGQNWTTSYSEAMMLAYPKLEKNTILVDAIMNLE